MKKLITLITALLFLQGCSSKEKFSTEQLQNLTNSVTINQLEKTEFNIGENKLVITTNEEVVTKEELDKLLSTLKVNNFSGKQLVEKSINSKEFDNKDFNVEIITKNNNLKEDGKLFLEIGYMQKQEVFDIAKENGYNQENISCIKDLENRDRVIILC